jgi:hypothetical protein
MLDQYAKLRVNEHMIVISACVALIRATVMAMDPEQRQQVRDQLNHTMH